jgi:hypothetical protein
MKNDFPYRVYRWEEAAQRVLKALERIEQNERRKALREQVHRTHVYYHIETAEYWTNKL